MSNGELKYRVTVDGKGAQAELQGVGGAVKSTNAAAGAGTGLWLAYTGAMKAATAAVRGFFAALGVIGAIMAGISLAISLFGKLKDAVLGSADAEEEAAERAKRMKEAQEEWARKAKEGIDAAREAEERYIETLKKAQQIEEARVAAQSKIRGERGERERMQIDRQVARGEISAPAATLEKEMVTLRARREDIEAEMERLRKELEDADAHQAEAFEAAEASSAREWRLKEANDEAAAEVNRVSRPRAGNGYIAAGEQQQEINAAERHHREVNMAWQAAEQETAELEEQARKAGEHYEEVERRVNLALEVLAEQLETTDAKIAANNEAFSDLIPQQEKANSEALEAARRSRARADIDAEVSRGEKSQAVGELEKKRIDLERQLAEAQAAVDKRRQQLEESGWDLDSDKVLEALREGAAEAQTRLDINAAALEKAQAGRVKAPAAEPTVTAGSDPWRKVGAFVNGGTNPMTDKALQVWIRQLTMQERSNYYLDKIQRQVEKLEATT